MKTPALIARISRRLSLLVMMVVISAPVLLHGSNVAVVNPGSRHCSCTVTAVDQGSRLVAVSFGGLDVGGVPSKVFLDQNYPNPFNPSTMIPFGIPQATYVKVTLHTLVGNTIMTLVDGWREAGTYVIDLSAQDLPSGVYFYRLQTEFGSITRRLTVSK